MTGVHVVHLDGNPRQQRGMDGEVIQGKKDSSDRMRLELAN